MDLFIQTVENLDLKVMKQEIAGKKVKNSAYVNNVFDTIYPYAKKFKSTSAKLFNIWKKTIQNSFVRNNIVSRIWFKVFKATDTFIKALYDNENTSESNFAKLRKVIQAKYGHDSEVYKQSIYKMGVSQERSIERRQEYSDRVRVRNVERGGKESLYVEDILKMISVLGNSNNVYENLLAVMLAIGSRPIEVLKVSQIKETDKVNEIYIKGIAKDKFGKNNFKNVVVLRQIVGLTGDQVVDLVDNIRNTINVRGNNQIVSNRVAPQLNEIFKKTVQKLAPNLPMTAYSCRAISANMAYELYAKPKNIAYESYVNEWLGHKSSESTKSYLWVNLKRKEEIIRDAPDDIKRIFDSKIVELEKKLDKCCPIPDEKIDGLVKFKNSRTRKEKQPEKIEKVVGALKYLKEKNIKMSQKALQKQLEFSSSVMSAAYQKARESGII